MSIPTITELPSLDFSSGYVQRSIAKMPKQGSKRPWRLYQNYALDIVTLALRQGRRRGDAVFVKPMLLWPSATVTRLARMQALDGLTV